MKKLAFILSSALVGCSGDDPGRGSLSFSTWGEDFIEQQIPSSAFEDGWSVKYDKFLLVIRAITVAEGSAVGAKQTGAVVFDMVKPGVKPIVSFADLEAKNWTTVNFQVGPMSADATLGPGVTEADKTLLGTASLRAQGSATKGAVTKKFDWTFTKPTLFDECRGEKDGREVIGALVTNGGTDQVQITIHGDHLFYDDLQAANAKLRFGAIANADADADGTVTQAELDKVRLTSIPKDQGPYGTGSATGVDTLGAFVASLARTVGHFRGEGECFAKDVR